MGRTTSGFRSVVAGPRAQSTVRRRWLWAAAVLAGLGVWLQDTATPWLMSGLTGDTRLIAGAQAASTLAVCVAVPLAGALTDLVDTARLLRGAHVALAAVALLVAIVVLAEVVGPASLLLLATAMGLGHGVLIAGWPTLIGAGVGGVPLAAAHSGHQWAGRTLGGPLAGTIIATVGIGAAFCADAGAFLAVALSLGCVAPTKATKPVTVRRWGAALRTGLQTTVLSPSALHAVICGSIGAFGLSALWSLLVVLARGELGLGAVGFGLLQAAAGAGAAGGILVVVRSARRRMPAAVTMGCLLAAGGCAVGLIAAIPGVVPLTVAAVVAGAAWVGCVVVLVVVLQAAVPAHMRARALGFGLGAFYLATALGSVLWGHAALWVGVPSTLCLAAAVTVSGALVAVRLRMGRLPRR